MEFRDLKKQYLNMEEKIKHVVQEIMEAGKFIGGEPVDRLEKELSGYVGAKHCITCANGTDALQLALMSWGIGEGDAVFVPDFTFFSTAEAVSWAGATPIFVDVEKTTFNMSVSSLEDTVIKIIRDGILKPKAVIAVDLFGLPADYDGLKKIAKQYGLLLLEDGAQGFGGMIGNKRACSFGDIATTSFFPAKPLGCYGDGGAVFTDDDNWAELIRSLKVHGKGENKYDNVRIGLNSRLDTIQAGVLLVKFKEFAEHELASVNQASSYYSKELSGLVDIPVIPAGFQSSWAQYTIRLEDEKTRNRLQEYLKSCGIPSMVYYMKPLHCQKAFSSIYHIDTSLENTKQLCNTVLSIPIHPYITLQEQADVCQKIRSFFNGEQEG